VRPRRPQALPSRCVPRYPRGLLDRCRHEDPWRVCILSRPEPTVLVAPESSARQPLRSDVGELLIEGLDCPSGTERLERLVRVLDPLIKPRCLVVFRDCGQRRTGQTGRFFQLPLLNQGGREVKPNKPPTLRARAEEIQCLGRIFVCQPRLLKQHEAGAHVGWQSRRGEEVNPCATGLRSCLLDSLFGST
jgi:hypothetical protein